MSNKAEYTIEKSTVENYKIRHPSGMYWADITIDDNGTAGRIQIASDYGNWQNYWSHCGMLFKEFLIGLGIDYSANKFGCNKYFDLEVNIKNVKNHVIEMRKENFITKDQARKLFDEIKELDVDGIPDANSFYVTINNTQHLREMYYSGDFDIVTSTDPGYEQFWKNVWPVFITELQNEKQLSIGK